MFTLITTTPQVLGCTPCECGVPGACLQERMPFFLQFIPSDVLHLLITFMTPFIIVLVTSLLARWALKHLLRNINATVVNSIAVFIGSLFVWRYIFSYFQPNILAEIMPLIASVASIVIVYTLFAILDLRKKKTALLHSILGLLVVLGLTAVATFTVRYARFSQYSQIVTSKRQSVVDVLKPLGLLERSDEVVDLLETNNYETLGKYISPTMKINISFRDYSGVNFNKNEFLSVVQDNQLAEVNAYKRVDDFTITVAELLNVVSEVLSSNYEADYYVDNHNYTEEGKELSEYGELQKISMTRY
ncbi:hypothetical protein ACFL0Y_00945 [Patescibacteria group bacterium]